MFSCILKRFYYIGRQFLNCKSVKFQESNQRYPAEKKPERGIVWPYSILNSKWLSFATVGLLTYSTGNWSLTFGEFYPIK